MGLMCGACSGVIGQPEPGDAGAHSERAAADGGTASWLADAATRSQPVQNLSRRLSRAELDHSLADLFGDTSAPATRMLPEDLYSPYDNDIDSQSTSSAFVDSLAGLASDVAERAASAADVRARLVPCEPQSPSDEDCFRRVVSLLLPRALRRPVKDSELAPYLALLNVANAPDQTQRPGFEMARSC